MTLTAMPWAASENFVEVGSDHGDDGEDGAFEEDLHGGREAEREQAADAGEIGAPIHVDDAIAEAALVAEHGNQQHERDVEAREGCRNAGAFETHAGRAPVAVHEEPVAGEVDEVGADHGEGDGPDDVLRLQIAAEGRVEEQGQHAPEQGVDEGGEQIHDTADWCRWRAGRGW